MKKLLLLIICLLGFLATANADVRLSNVFGDHMVLQRDKAVPVFGTASPGEQVTVKFHGQSVAAMADSQGNWQVKLAAMNADTNAQTMTVIGANTITVADVLVGDVWLCGGQSNMEMRLSECDRPEDIQQADFPGIRSIRAPIASAESPQKMLKGDPRWAVCNSRTAGSYSAAAFYFARKIYRENNSAIPIGLIVSSVGGTPIDVWLSPESLIDMPVLKPLLTQKVLPEGPFHFSYAMIHPLAPYGIRGAIWYQGENAEKTVQSPDSYFLKMQALMQGWKRLWEMDDLPFYYVMIANYGKPLQTDTPVLHSGEWDADTRLQQVNALALPHAGCASAIDLGVSEVSWPGFHPKNKLDVGERLALWALKNEYGHPALVAGGPVLSDVSVSGSTVLCSFDNVGGGLMVGSKTWYKPTEEIPGGTLRRFVIAGADGKWFPAQAVIKGSQVIMSSPSVPEPRQVSYATWQNPEGCNLYNKEGLPAAPFHVTDVTQHYRITASAGAGGTITSSGAHSLLPRMTALYSIVPDAGHFIQNVTIDGVSVGSVRNYTFDPIYANHAIEATFTTTPPIYTITASAGGGGKLTPSGPAQVTQGNSQKFAINPDTENLSEVTVNGTRLGPRSSVNFTDVRANYSVTAAFSSTIKATAGYGGTISPDGTVPVAYGANRSFAIAPIPGYSIAAVNVDGINTGLAGDQTFTNVIAHHTIAAAFKSLADIGTGSVPQPEQLLLACRSDALQTQGEAASWPAFFPEGKKLAAIGTPAMDIIDSGKYTELKSESADGFSAGTYSSPIACNGASVVVVARPMRNGVSAGWTSVVDIFFDRLVLGIRNDSGLVCVRRNGAMSNSTRSIPDGQITILSLVVQPDGPYQVYANGEEILSNKTQSAMTALTPGVAGRYATSITVGRNAPDAWTAFNGDVGDVFIYKVALSTDERRQLEMFLAKSLSHAKPAS